MAGIWPIHGPTAPTNRHSNGSIVGGVPMGGGLEFKFWGILHGHVITGGAKAELPRLRGRVAAPWVGAGGVAPAAAVGARCRAGVALCYITDEPSQVQGRAAVEVGERARSARRVGSQY